MSIEQGAYLGRIRNVEELRQRCHVDSDTGCWHYRGRCDSVSLMLANGERISRRIRRAALIVKRGMKDLPKGMQAYPAQCCHSDDCANPAHSRMGSRSAALKEHGRRGAFSAPERVACLRKSMLKRKIRTPEMDLAIANEPGKLRDIADKYGISLSMVKVAKRGGYAQKVVTDVFSWRPQ